MGFRSNLRRAQPAAIGETKPGPDRPSSLEQRTGVEKPLGEGALAKRHKVERAGPRRGTQALRSSGLARAKYSYDDDAVVTMHTLLLTNIYSWNGFFFLPCFRWFLFRRSEHTQRTYGGMLELWVEGKERSSKDRIINTYYIHTSIFRGTSFVCLGW